MAINPPYPFFDRYLDSPCHQNTLTAILCTSSRFRLSPSWSRSTVPWVQRPFTTSSSTILAHSRHLLLNRLEFLVSSTLHRIDFTTRRESITDRLWKWLIKFRTKRHKSYPSLECIPFHYIHCRYLKFLWEVILSYHPIAVLRLVELWLLAGGLFSSYMVRSNFHKTVLNSVPMKHNEWEVDVREQISLTIWLIFAEVSIIVSTYSSNLHPLSL